MPPNLEPTADDFFNDLSRRINENGSRARSRSPKNTDTSARTNDDPDGFVPRTKRIACIVCRKRKLKCDGTKPRCGTCARLGHSCAYDEVRKKSGPKRGYVKHLEARLAQVETLLKTHDPSDPAESSNPTQSMRAASFSDVSGLTIPGEPTDGIPQPGTNDGVSDPQIDSLMNSLGLASEPFSWEVISLGLEEPLPCQEIIDELHQIYFEKIQPFAPVIHRPRYLAAMNLAPHMRPPVCLRYAMWLHVCSITPKYSALTDHFYARTRKYAEQDEMRGFGEGIITVAHTQCWCLIALYEFKMMYFPRAWMSVGRASRLAQMLGLQRQDTAALDVKQTLPPARDWTEREERRRTFWLAFCQDRYASIGTGWPMTIDERDISTNLPASDEAFLNSKPEETLPLAGVMTPDGASTLSSFGAVVLMACLIGRNLTHLHRTDGEDNDHDLNGEFWKRHRSLDNILLNTLLSLPPQLRLPAGIHDSNIVFLNMNLHASTICLHQAAIFKAEHNQMSPQITSESKRRCIIAADQITNNMKLVSHIDLSTLNPFVAFCLYVAARVFVQYLKTHKDDATVLSSLQFLLVAMQALKAKNPLTESFLVQLDVELEGSGLQIPPTKSGQPPSILRACGGGNSQHIPASTNNQGCSPLVDIRTATAEQFTDEVRWPVNTKVPLSNVTEFPRMNYSGRVSSKYEEVSGIMDVDASIENMSNQRHSSMTTSGLPTASASPNNASSQNSFSPPNAEEHSNLTNTSSLGGMSPGTASAAAIYSDHQVFPSFDPGMANMSKVPGCEGAQNPFAMPASWSHENSRISPGNSAGDFDFSGMTSENVPNWQPMGVVEGEWLFSTWNGADTST